MLTRRLPHTENPTHMRDHTKERQMTTTLALADRTVDFPNHLDFEIQNGVLVVYTQESTRYFAPGYWQSITVTKR
jgi:hypothetical protein